MALSVRSPRLSATLSKARLRRICVTDRLLHGPTFQAQINDIAVRTIADYCMSSASDPAEVPSATIRNLHELAVLFGVLGLAMSICAGTLNPAECQRLGLSQRYIGREERTGQEWLRCALSALRLGREWILVHFSTSETDRRLRIS